MHYTPTDFLRLATTTAEHFGFRSIESLKRDPRCKKCATTLVHTAGATERKLDAIHGLLTAGMNTYCAERLYAYEGPVLFYTTEQVPRSGETALALHIFGVQKSIAESILIQAMRALVADTGYTDYNVRVNSLGDRDSMSRYIRELNSFFRKRVNDLPPSTRELLKEHVFTALMDLVELDHDLSARSPNPLEYLSDPSRKHFREIVEYLDMSEAPYEIDPKLLGHYQCYSDALFAIEAFEEVNETRTKAPLIIRGGRYDEFVHRNTQQIIPAVGAVAILNNSRAPSRNPRIKAMNPSVYVVQLGFGPKIRSLLLIEELRRAGVPVLQNLASNSLSEQLRDAELRGVDYVLIVGQKEFVEHSVILRDMRARNQEHVAIASLPQRLRRAVAVAA